MKTQSNSLAVHSAEMSDPSFIFDTAYAVEFSDPFFFYSTKGIISLHHVTARDRPAVLGKRFIISLLHMTSTDIPYQLTSDCCHS